MPELLLLAGDPAKARNDNPSRLERAFLRLGWTVTRADHDSVEIAGNRLRLAGQPPDCFDLIWLLGFGRAATAADRLQLLRALPRERFVTTPAAMWGLHGKHRWLDRMPETHTSASVSRLHAVIRGGGDWIVKPPAGSYGRDVTLFREGTACLEELQRLHDAAGGGYLMAQRYVAQIESGETRTLVAGGRLVGSYLRLPGQGQVANLAAGGQARAATLDEAGLAMVRPIAGELARLGVGFAAIDTVGGYLMEVNVANPGGLMTLEALYGHDPAGEVVRAILEWRGLAA